MTMRLTVDLDEGRLIKGEIGDNKQSTNCCKRNLMETGAGLETHWVNSMTADNKIYLSISATLVEQHPQLRTPASEGSPSRAWKILRVPWDLICKHFHASTGDWRRKSHTASLSLIAPHSDHRPIFFFLDRAFAIPTLS